MALLECYGARRRLSITAISKPSLYPVYILADIIKFSAIIIPVLLYATYNSILSIKNFQFKVLNFTPHNVRQLSNMLTNCPKVQGCPSSSLWVFTVQAMKLKKLRWVKFNHAPQLGARRRGCCCMKRAWFSSACMHDTQLCIPPARLHGYTIASSARPTMLCIFP